MDDAQPPAQPPSGTLRGILLYHPLCGVPLLCVCHGLCLCPYKPYPQDGCQEEDCSRQGCNPSEGFDGHAFGPAAVQPGPPEP